MYVQNISKYSANSQLVMMLRIIIATSLDPLKTVQLKPINIKPNCAELLRAYKSPQTHPSSQLHSYNYIIGRITEAGLRNSGFDTKN